MKLPFTKKSLDKNIIITGILIIAVIVVGFFSFTSWQNRVSVIDTAINQGRLPTSGDRQITKRPTLETGQPNIISIPARDIEAPVVYITPEQNNDDGHQEALVNGVVHYPGTVEIGAFGNPYIFGHSSDYFWKSGDYKQIFKPLIDIPLETEIRITNKEGELFIYRVFETKIVGPEEISVLSQQGHEKQLLTLQTSWPLGTALKRYIVVAELDTEATYGPLKE